MMFEAGIKRRGNEATKGNHTSRRGFSFPEILFAVAVLGIGFIMVAAIFPVAIMQTQATMDETIGTAAARNGVGYLRGTAYMTSGGMPYTKYPPPAPPPPTPTAQARVFWFNDPRIAGAVGVPPIATTQAQMWDSVRKAMISPDDPRFAYIPMFQRDEASTFAKVILIGVRVRNRAQFEEATDAQRRASPNDFYVAELEPRPVRITQLTDGGAGADTITIAPLQSADDPTLFTSLTAAGAASAVDAAVEGAYVIISDDRVPDDYATVTPAVNETGKLNGRIYRLGSQIGPGQFELSPELDMANNTENLPKAPAGPFPVAFVVGRGYSDPMTPGNGYGGGNQAVQRYEMIVNLP
jgi:prepilin-type N-terminal cleavage/methylation domain-containing protein